MLLMRNKTIKGCENSHPFLCKKFIYYKIKYIISEQGLEITVLF